MVKIYTTIILGGVPVVCGGSVENLGVERTCYKYSFKDNVW